MPKKQKEYAKHRYTAAQKEILCTLDAGDDENAVEWQKELAGELAGQIENDVENTLYNQDKINKFREQAGLTLLKDETRIALNTENVQTGLSWLTSFRLFIGRVNNILAVCKLGFLPKFFDLLGLSFIFELIIDVIDICITTGAPLRKCEKDLINSGTSPARIYWWRLINKIWQDEELIPRMLNAVVWFGLNLTAFILTGGFSIASPAVSAAIKLLVVYLNIGGGMFDFLLEVGKGIRDFWQHSNTLIKVNEEIIYLRKKELFLKNGGYELALMSTLPGNENKNAEFGKIYLKENGDYIVRGLNGEIHQGSIVTIDLKSLPDRTNDRDLKKDILLAITTLLGHTIHTKRDLIDAGKKDSEEYEAVCKKCADIEKKIQSRKTLKVKLEEKIDYSLIPTRIYNCVVMGAISFSLGLLAAGKDVLTLASRIISLTAGSVFGGLGRRVWHRFVVPSCKFLWNKAIVPAWQAVTEAISPTASSAVANHSLITNANPQANNGGIKLPAVPVPVPVPVPALPIPVPTKKSNHDKTNNAKLRNTLKRKTTDTDTNTFEPLQHEENQKARAITFPPDIKIHPSDDTSSSYTHSSSSSPNSVQSIPFTRKITDSNYDETQTYVAPRFVSYSPSR